MIGDHKTREVAWYLPIDHCREGVGIVTPATGETFIGVPYQCYTDNSEPYIEVRLADNTLVRTVNALDCSEIGFKKTYLNRRMRR